jgi:hypothetical protein
MPITARLYIFEEGGAVKRVPRRVADAMIFGNEALPEYSNSRQRIATAIVENDDWKPARILDVQGHYWSFDAE